MARLPIPRKRPPSKRELAVRRIAQAWTAMKVTSMGARAAMRGAKTVRAAKGATGRGKAKLLVIPAAVAGGVIVWRKARAGNHDQPREDFDRPLGPVATADAVSPPETSAATSAQQG